MRAGGGWLRLLLDPGTAAGQGRPLLDPRGWTVRHRYFLYAGLLVAILAGLVESVQAGPLTGGAEGIRAFLAAAFAVALAGLALSLRGLTLPGLLLGGVFVVAGMLSWAYTGTPLVVWAVLGLEGVLFAVWTFPWLRDLARLPRLGAAWLGLAYWFLGVLGALLVWHPTVTAQRIAYGGVFTLAALAVVVATRKSGRDMTVGIVAAFLLAFAVLFLVGSGNLLDNLHAVPHNAWGRHMQYRFWGGPGLLYHPNSIAVVAVMITLRIAPDRHFERWQRYAVLVMVTIVLLLVNSRTGLLYLGFAAALHALLVLRQRRGGAPDDGMQVYSSTRAAWLAALVPLAMVLVIGIGSGGAAFLTANRYSSAGDDMTSGRTATWAAVFTEFKADTIAEKLFGDAKNARATVTRATTGTSAADRPKLTTDNSAVGALRRGGILGEVAFLLGLALLLWHAIRGVPVARGVRRAPPAWFTLSAVGALASIPFADWLLGGTGGTLWVYLLAGEAALFFTPAGDAVRDQPAS
ncbi:MAG: hypothetical protein V7603_6088 [Micromonosporaceae bacterium]